MAKSRPELLQALNESVRSAGQGGKTTAQDLRGFLTTLVDELLERTAASEVSVLEFVFEAQFADEVTRTMGVTQAGEYLTQNLQNVTTVAYKVNNADAALPFTLAAGDALTVLLTRTDAAQAALVSLQN